VDAFAHIVLATANEVTMMIARADNPAAKLGAKENAFTVFLDRLRIPGPAPYSWTGSVFLDRLRIPGPATGLPARARGLALAPTGQTSRPLRGARLGPGGLARARGTVSSPSHCEQFQGRALLVEAYLLRYYVL